MVKSPQKTFTSVQVIKEWLTVLALLVSLGGITLNLFLKPSADIVTLNGRVDSLEKEVKWLKEDINLNLQRIWVRIK